MLRGRVCFSQGILKALLLHMISLWKCLEGVSCCFCDLLGCGCMGCHYGSHNALHPKGVASLWAWLPGTAHTTCLTHSSCSWEFSGYLCAFSALGLAGELPAFLCSSEQPFQLSTAVVEEWATVGDSPALQRLMPAKSKRCLVVCYVMVHSPQKLILFVSSFFPSGF